jgi:hypothetical protein
VLAWASIDHRSHPRRPQSTEAAVTDDRFDRGRDAARHCRRSGPPALAIAFICAVVAVATPSAALAQKTFYIDESTDFSGNGCENADLNDVTSSLRSTLASNGWTGSRFTGALAWPQDYIESTFAGRSGVDNAFGDNALLTVYAGHGNRALVQFGNKRLGRCTVSLENDARLGLSGGARAVYAMYVTSCTLNLDSLSRNFNHEIRQQFGYHNSPPVKDDQPRDFFNATDGKTNAQAWIDEMEDRPGWFTGDNSPIALTHGIDASHCDFVRNTARLRGGSLLFPPPKPWGWFCWIMRDHGASGC